MKEYYKWCSLKKELGNGYAKLDNAWIPERYAKEGKCLKIKDEDGWKVVSAGDRVEARLVEGRERDYRHQREVSDI